ncbi:MAG: hypothetical protein ACXW24_15305 [Telluria sp.]
MNIAKNMEAIFIIAVALGCATAYASSSAPAAQVQGDDVALSTGKRPAAD